MLLLVLGAVFLVVRRRGPTASSSDQDSVELNKAEFDERASVAHDAVMERFATERDEELPPGRANAYAKTPDTVDAPSAYAKTPVGLDTKQSSVYAKTPGSVDNTKESSAYAKTPGSVDTPSAYAKTPG